jgi:hypothetical protein
MVTAKMYQNWHHYFVDITIRDPTKLVPVTMEPEEINRQSKLPQVLKVERSKEY